MRDGMRTVVGNLDLKVEGRGAALPGRRADAVGEPARPGSAVRAFSGSVAAAQWGAGGTVLRTDMFQWHGGQGVTGPRPELTGGRRIRIGRTAQKPSGRVGCGSHLRHRSSSW